jgi:solute carrier family 6 amino acid transporter-like protein 5/7/9/14
MKEKDSVEDGIGVPDLQLALFLFASWIVIFIVNIKGIKSSGKVSYFLALFPYCVLITLLVKASMLEGALNGIKYFIKPDFSKLLEPQVCCLLKA